MKLFWRQVWLEIFCECLHTLLLYWSLVWLKQYGDSSVKCVADHKIGTSENSELNYVSGTKLQKTQTKQNWNKTKKKTTLKSQEKQLLRENLKLFFYSVLDFVDEVLAQREFWFSHLGSGNSNHFHPLWVNKLKLGWTIWVKLHILSELFFHSLFFHINLCIEFDFFSEPLLFLACFPIISDFHLSQRI